MNKALPQARSLPTKRRRSRTNWRREMPLHLMLVPGLLIVLVYHYLPIAGIVMAFQKFNPVLSFWKSPFVGWENFEYIFKLPEFYRALGNTVVISAMKVVAGIAVPLLLALMINEVRRTWFKRTVQTAIFLPYFLSWAVLGGIVRELFSLNGPINQLIVALGQEPIMFMASNSMFRGILVATDVWKGCGYNVIIYLAAIAGIDTALYEAAGMDGCGRLRSTWHVTLPGMLPIVILLSTLSIGSLLNAGFDQVLILYNPLVYQSADIIDTFVYRFGLVGGQLAPATAVGLFKSVVSLGLVGIAYYAAYRFSDYRIF